MNVLVQDRDCIISGAIDNQLYVATCSPTRDAGAGNVAWGHSTLVGPFGEILATTEHDEAIIISEVDYSQIELRRKYISSFKPERAGKLGVFKNHVPQLLRDNQTKHLLNTFVQNLVYEPMLSRFANEGGLIGSSPAEVSKAKMVTQFVPKKEKVGVVLPPLAAAAAHSE
ncbi:hypothetical protein LOK49_LG10G03086 [Camellia lanceoleosa]|uniref:Uncharacterized protein n=1 Tax=Camellia lanceoleosa TaxID=1840588 RepID=A0ACC0G9A3_9ERIC|nr:hypothetical protein LOK49_LG10G03086 [Camellia lanceoleosa]